MLAIVPGEGPKSALIALVGEAPGPDETHWRRPFIGKAGQKLDELLSFAGISRDSCYITNVCETQPETAAGVPALKFSLHPPEYVAEQTKRLIAELKATAATVVVALGNEALEALTGKRGIKKWRGSILWSDAIGKKVVATIHPSALFKEPAYEPLVTFDLKRAKQQSSFAAYHTPQRELLLNPHFEIAEHHLRRMIADRKPVSFDIENTPATGNLLCIAFSDRADWAMTIPWAPETMPALVIDLVRQLLTDPLVPKIAQNAQYDVLWLRHYFGWHVTPIVFDTMTAHATVYPEIKKDLGTLGSIYTEQPYHKGMLDERPGDVRALWEYNALDAAVTYECYQALRADLSESGQDRFYATYVLPLTAPLMDMQERGVAVDLAMRDRVAAELQEEIADHSAQAQFDGMPARVAWFPAPEGRNPKGVAVSVPHQGLNVLSPSQLKVILYETLKLPKRTDRKTGSLTTNEQALNDLAMTYKHPLLQRILEIRRRQKLLSTYVLARLSPENRLQCSYVVGGTETGRLASRQSIYDTGTNLQNVPRTGPARKMVVPDSGLVFLEADLSQAEARVVAYLADDPFLIELFASGRDVHLDNAARIFKKAVGDVTPSERELAKRLVHAANYGIGPQKFVDTVFELTGIVLKVDQAITLLDAYFATFPRIKTWQAQVRESLRRHNGTLTTPLGGQRTFFAWFRKETLREALAYVPQHVVAHLLNRGGLIDLPPRLPTVDSQAAVMLTVHDSILLQCRQTHLAPVMRLVRECLEKPITFPTGKTLTIPCEFKTGPNWGELSKVKA